MSSVNKPHHDSAYWRSLDQLADTPQFRAFAEAEFPAGGGSDGMSRRRWLQLMGASLALAGVGGCRWEKEEILPLKDRPGGRIPGEPQRFATAMDLAGSALGLLVTSFDGRPVKIEGNPEHPASLGATDVFAQAAILQLYDPDRSRNVHQSDGSKEIVRNWEDFAEFARSHFDELRQNHGAGFRILAEAGSSPTLDGMRSKLHETFPEAQWHEYEPISRDNERAGAEMAFGKPYRTQLALDKAKVIVCLDADLLGSHPAAVRYARHFAQGRQPSRSDMKMNRLYAVESRLSVTGAAADHRLALPPSRVANFASILEEEITALLKRPDGGSEPSGARKKPDQTGRPILLFAMAEDLVAHRGSGVVAVGPSQPPEVHAAVHRINAMLGNVGQDKAVTYTADPEPQRPSHLDAIRSLVEEMAAGKVQTLLILGGNPVYNAPADLGFVEALGKIETTIHLSLYRDETSRACAWHVPQAHFLESWGDARAWDGTYGIVQPLIAPLYGGRSAIELLGRILDGRWPDSRQLVRTTFDRIAGESSEKMWRKAVHDGLLQNSAWPVETPSVDLTSQPVAEARSVPESAETDGQLEIVFCRDASVYDGRFANNGWLQEMPDPMTRLTWDNAALVSPATAKALGVEDGTLLKLKYRGRDVEIPAYVMPGQAPGSVAVMLGYGRTAAGHVGSRRDDEVEPVGVDVYALRTSEAMQFDTGLTVEPTGKKYPLAGTQDHFAIDTAGRNARAERVGTLVRETTLKAYQEYTKLSEEERKHVDITGHPIHHPPLESLWQEPPFDEADRRWAMAIDLSKCIGCGACVVACQAENNVPVVGKQQVLNGREMHWLRVDRYFKGDPDDPQIALQPVPCQQCEMAPCEQVCPVAATVHSIEGLNDQVYNRCVGTRYCANNCPYKVRRFNYFNYHTEFKDPDNEVAKMVYNPEVTVRSRGVMEKCTYCVQRIQAVKIEAKNKRPDRHIEDGRIQTACQQACPTGAIVFGDLGPPKQRPGQWSEVRRAHQSDRCYAMLEELNVKPRTKYLARIRNPNPQLERDSEGHG